MGVAILFPCFRCVEIKLSVVQHWMYDQSNKKTNRWEVTMDVYGVVVGFKKRCQQCNPSTKRTTRTTTVLISEYWHLSAQSRHTTT